MKARCWCVVQLLLLLAVGASAAEVAVLRLDDVIYVGSQHFVERGLDEAAQRGVDLLILELDTPGGMLDATRNITSAMTSSTVPVAVYVAPTGARAASAGFFILISADIAAMAPGTNTGASHPVLMPQIPGLNPEVPDEMIDKAVNDAAAMVRSLAQDRGRNVEEAVRTVTESISFTAKEALEKNLIDLIATSRQDLIDQLDGREVTRIDGSTVVLNLGNATITNITPTRKERFQSIMASPVLAFFLLVIAGLGIYTEITHPGTVLPGVVGVIALIGFLYSTSVLPLNWIGLALIIVAVAMFILEVKVTSYGLLTLGGIACFVAGSLMLFDTPIPEMRLGLAMVIPTAVVIAAVMIFLLQRVIKAHQQRAITGQEGLVGELGHTLTPLTPSGKVKVFGEYWDARAAEGSIAAGTPVVVQALQGRQLVVAPAEEAANMSDEEGGR